MLPFSINGFWSRVDKNTTTGCWLWLGALDKDGYGVATRNYVTWRAHKLVWIVIEKKLVPNGFHLHHTCKTKNCVNPEHLRCVNPREHSNLIEHTKTHCPRGHEYNEKNTYSYKRKGGLMERGCRVCRRLSMRNFLQRESDKNKTTTQKGEQNNATYGRA